MAKLTKHAEVLSRLHDIIKKEAEAQAAVTGVPGKDTKVTSVKDNDTVAKNEVKPENNTPQNAVQKPSTDASKPAAKVAELGSEILDMIKEKQAEGEKKEVQEAVTGKPADAGITSVKDNDTVAKNEVKPENNTPQNIVQKPSTDKAEPAKAAEAADAEKKASYELGKKLAEELLKQAGVVQDESAMMKEAGRRDFDMLIAQAAEELQKEQAEKQAEAAGAAAFDTLLKQAAVEVLVEENKQLKEKVAAFEAKHEKKETPAEEKVEEAAKKEVKEEKKEVAPVIDQAKMASEIAAQVMSVLKNELANKPVSK